MNCNDTETVIRIKSGYDRLSDWFTEYSESFLNGDPDIAHGFELKIIHTRKVDTLAGEIAENIELNELHLYGAKLAALLHDVGRFRQFRDYRTFNDSQSEDHGKIGIDVIEEEKLLQPVDEVSPETGAAVRFAVFNHNKLAIPENIDELPVLFSKIVRDADRIDIIRILMEQLEQPLKPGQEAVFLYLDDSGEISDAVFSAVLEGRMVERKDLQGRADFLCMILSWIEIMNFSCSCEVIDRDGKYHALLEHLPGGTRGDRVRHIFLGSMKRRLKQRDG